MKISLVSLMIALALSLSARATDVSTKISDVHLCCQSCVKGVHKAVADIKGLTATVDEVAETVTLTIKQAHDEPKWHSHKVFAAPAITSASLPEAR